jgi:predicted transcriptional regulator
MAQTKMTIQVDPDLKAAFTQVAEAHNRSEEDLLREFMQDYIATCRTDSEYQHWFNRQVQIGVAEADAGQVDPAEDVEAEFSALRTSALSKMPKSA